MRVAWYEYTPSEDKREPYTYKEWVGKVLSETTSMYEVKVNHSLVKSVLKVRCRILDTD